MNRNFLSSYILILVAAGLLLIIAITDRRDLTSAAGVISAMILFLTGIFLFTFAKKESIDEHILSLIPVQSQLNICRIASALGVNGNSWFLPGDLIRGLNCVQFIPVSTYLGGDLEGSTFVSGPGGTGMVLPPAGSILMSDLKKRSGLIIPDSMDEIFILIKEAGEELLEVAESIEVQKSGDVITISLDNYALIEGCRKVMAESPACCSMNPCPICSFFGMIITEGLHQPVIVEQCRPNNQKPQVEILFSLFKF